MVVSDSDDVDDDDVDSDDSDDVDDTDFELAVSLSGINIILLY
jgi:hypothetical protein